MLWLLGWLRPRTALRRIVVLAVLALLAATALGAGPGGALRRAVDAVRDATGGRGASTVARITHVRDGDTVEAGGDVWRLIGIDTPESVRPGTPVECGALEAKDHLLRLVYRHPPDTDGDALADADGRRGARVRFAVDPSQDAVDRYGRRLGYATVVGQRRTLQQRMLAAGWASVYVYRSQRFRRFRTFVAAARAARRAHRGVYGRCGGDFHRPL